MRLPQADATFTLSGFRGIDVLAVDVSSGATMILEAKTEAAYTMKTPPLGVGRHCYGESFIYTVLPRIDVESIARAITGEKQVFWLVDSTPVPPEPPLIESLPRSTQLLRFAPNKPVRRLPPRRPNISPLLSDIDEV